MIQFMFGLLPELVIAYFICSVCMKHNSMVIEKYDSKN